MIYSLLGSLVVLLHTANYTAGSPTSAMKPKLSRDAHAPGGGSSGSDSDDESYDIDAGSCEQGVDVILLKRVRRLRIKLLTYSFNHFNI